MSKKEAVKAEPENKQADPLAEIAPILEKIENRAQLIRFVTKEELATLRKHCYGTKEQIAARLALKAKQKALREAAIAEAEEKAKSLIEEAKNK